MGRWVKALEAKAGIIHGQLAEARKLAAEAGLDPEEVSEPYLDLIKALYLDACEAEADCATDGDAGRSCGDGRGWPVEEDEAR